MFLATFLAVFAASLGGREAVRVARLSAALGADLPLFLAVAIAAIAGAAMAAFLGTGLTELLTERSANWLTAAALAITGAEVLFLRAGPAPREPTRSLFAITVVLLAGVVAEAAGFMVLAFAASSRQPIFVGAGGALGALFALGGAALAGTDWQKLPLRAVSWIAGGGLMFGAVVIAMRNL